MPGVFLCRHPARLLERALSIDERFFTALLSGFASSSEATRLSSVPVVPFHCRADAIRFPRLTSAAVAGGKACCTKLQVQWGVWGIAVPLLRTLLWPWQARTSLTIRLVWQILSPFFAGKITGQARAGFADETCGDRVALDGTTTLDDNLTPIGTER